MCENGVLPGRRSGSMHETCNPTVHQTYVTGIERDSKPISTWLCAAGNLFSSGIDELLMMLELVDEVLGVMQ